MSGVSGRFLGRIFVLPTKDLQSSYDPSMWLRALASNQFLVEAVLQQTGPGQRPFPPLPPPPSDRPNDPSGPLAGPRGRNIKDHDCAKKFAWMFPDYGKLDLPSIEDLVEYAKCIASGGKHHECAKGQLFEYFKTYTNGQSEFLAHVACCARAEAIGKNKIGDPCGYGTPPSKRPGEKPEKNTCWEMVYFPDYSGASRPGGAACHECCNFRSCVWLLMNIGKGMPDFEKFNLTACEVECSSAK